MLPDALVQALATAPGQILTTREIRRLGFDREQVAVWAREGLLARLLHGTYRDAAVPPPDDQLLHAVLRYLQQRQRAGTKDSILTGTSVLALHRVAGFDLPTRVAVLVDHRRHPRNPRFDVHRVDLAAVPTEWVRGLPCAVAERAVADAALNPSVTDERLRSAVDQLRSRRLLVITSAAQTWASVAHGGSARLLAMYRAGVFDMESDGERHAHRLLFAGRRPLPDCQVVLVGNLRADFVFLDAALVIEYYGGVHDGRADQDATRIHALELAGYRVIVVTRSMLRNHGHVAAHIHETRQRRAHLMRAGVLPRPQLPAQPPRRLPLRTLSTAA